VSTPGNGDIKRKVIAACADPKKRHWSQRQMAAHFRCSRGTVSTYVKEFRRTTGLAGPRAGPTPRRRPDAQRTPEDGHDAPGLFDRRPEAPEGGTDGC
jgi:hypothetical protein